MSQPIMHSNDLTKEITPGKDALYPPLGEVLGTNPGNVLIMYVSFN